MGKSPTMGSGTGTAQWSNDYYKTKQKGTDWQKYITNQKNYTPQQPQYNYQVDQSRVQPTAYQPAEQDAVSKISQLIQSGGYAPEQKQTMYTGAMQPVYEEAEKMREQAEADAYARGLGQSGVLSRSYGDINKGLLSQAAQVSGSIEQASAENAAQNALSAIQAMQQGQASQQQVSLSLEQMRQQNAQAEAQIDQAYEQLMQKANIDDRQMQAMMAQLSQTSYMNDVEREQNEMQIRNNFNLSQAELEQAKWIAEQKVAAERRNFIGNIFGGILGSAATVAGGALQLPETTNYYGYTPTQQAY